MASHYPYISASGTGYASKKLSKLAGNSAIHSTVGPYIDRLNSSRILGNCVHPLLLFQDTILQIIKIDISNYL